MPTIEELAEKYKTGKIISPAQIDIDDLADRYRVRVPSKTIVTATPKASDVSAAAGIKRGISDVSDTLDTVFQPTVGRLLNMPPTGEARKARREQYEKDFAGDTAADIGRVGGQVAATAPLVPAGGIRAAFGAMPIITATGEKIAAPALNRLGATIGTGLAGGGVFGAATNAVNENGLASNIASNAAMGAAGAPIIAGAGKLGAMVIPGARSLRADFSVYNAARQAGLPPSAIKNVVGMLDEAGLTADQARMELNRLGAKGTLGDIDPALQAEISGLSQLGGKPTSILRNRYGARAEGANDDATKLIETRLGPKPDLEAEKEAIVKQAQKLAGPDYKKAHASTDRLSISGLITHIDGELKNAVGSRAAILKEIKGYLFKETKAADGTITKSPKELVSELHPVREEIDDILRKRGEGLSPHTFSKVETVRDKLDTVLKSNTHMKAGDEVFSKHMTNKDGLQIGYDALTKKTTKEEFAKVFNGASPELQETIRKGLRAAIGDVMEASAQGEGSAAQRLFNKKAVNKEILRTAYGSHGESVIDAIHDEVAQRGTEYLATKGSQTALNQAIRRKYEGGDRPHLGDMALGAAIDAHGAGGYATAVMAGKRFLSNRLIGMSENKLGRLTEGSADILSRQGPSRDTIVDTLAQVSKIQNRLRASTKIERLNLPSVPTLAAPFGGKAYDQVKDKIQ